MTNGRSPRLRRPGYGPAMLLAALILSPAVAHAQEACWIESAKFCDGCTVSRRITVQKDSGCVLTSRSPGALLGTSTTVPPKHGSFGKADQTHSAYLPRRGFVGEDFFVFVLSYESFGRTGRVTVQNRVTVKDGAF